MTANFACTKIFVVLHALHTYIHTYIQLKFDSAALTKVKSSDALQ